MKKGYIFRISKYLFQISWGKNEAFDEAITHESNDEIKYYILFKRHFFAKNYDECYYDVIEAYRKSCLHWDSLETFLNSVLPLMIEDKRYEIAEKMIKGILENNIPLNKANKENAYHALVIAIYYQGRYAELKELIEFMEADSMLMDHKIISWYRENAKE